MRTGVEVCWDCVKGRHLICTGRSEREWPGEDAEQGPPCECPVDHSDPHANVMDSGMPTCQPVWTPAGYYVSPLEVMV